MDSVECASRERDEESGVTHVLKSPVTIVTSYKLVGSPEPLQTKKSGNGGKRK